MPRPVHGSRLLVALAAVLSMLVATPAAASAADRGPERIPGRYVVVYKDSVQSVTRSTDRREQAHGFRSRLRYASALKGFAARLTPGQVRALRRDSAVDYVAPDLRVRASAQTIPVGITRIGAAGSSGQVHGPSGVGVAVIDTGVDLDHPDLNVASGGKNCVGGSSADDDHGHGTHVAGTIAATNNTSDVVGVAPGTTVHAVKVLDGSGSGSTSSVVCGINWVAANAGAKNIGVANMSLGGGGEPLGTCGNTTDPEHQAICDATAGGVAFAVAAGNDGWDFDYKPQPDIPAAYPQVVTVAAMGDTDGKPGALGSKCSRESDDRYTSWSNYAARSTGDWPGVPHTMAAPGLCVVSTKMGGGITSMSGTSMAAPHVAGALALCVNEGGTNGPCATVAKNDPVALISKLVNTDPLYGFTGDPGNGGSSTRYYGYLLHSPLTTLSDGGGTTDTTAPATPTGLAATAGDARVDLSWNANSESDLKEYVLRRDGVEIYRGLSRSYTDTAVSNGTTYAYTVSAVDTSLNESAQSASVSATPAATSTGEGTLTLSATGYKVKGLQKADLTWGGATSTSVDIYRDGALRATVANQSPFKYTDHINKKGGGTYRYKVCEAGTSTCSGEVTVTF